MADQLPEVSELTKTLLESGIVDQSMAELLEKWGTLPDGASQYVNNDALKESTRSQLRKLADQISEQVEKHRVLRETQFDLDRLKWPVTVDIWDAQWHQLAEGVSAVIDRMGRYYFRAADVEEKWFAPGHHLAKTRAGNRARSDEVILESQFLYIGDQKAALQVSVRQEA